jgi:hypothetical protein
MVLVAVQLSVPGWYLPPVFTGPPGPAPPQMIISLPTHTAVNEFRGEGAFVRLVAVQLSVLGLYLPPVFTSPESPNPPQMIISVPVQTAAFLVQSRPAGAFVRLVAVQLSVPGSYLPPVFV